MEVPPWWASVFAVVPATVVFLRAVFGRRRRPCRTLPGPKPWPIIGNFNLLGALPHRSLDALSKRYGPLMRVQFGSFPVVVASSVDMAKFFLKTHDSVFIDRPKMAAGRYTTYKATTTPTSPGAPTPPTGGRRARSAPTSSSARGGSSPPSASAGRRRTRCCATGAGRPGRSCRSRSACPR
jgi:hypothetical protein